MYNPTGQQPKQEKCFYNPSEARTVTQRPALCNVEVRRALRIGLRKDTSVIKGHCFFKTSPLPLPQRSRVPMWRDMADFCGAKWQPAGRHGLVTACRSLLGIFPSRGQAAPRALHLVPIGQQFESGYP